MLKMDFFGISVITFIFAACAEDDERARQVNGHERKTDGLSRCPLNLNLRVAVLRRVISAVSPLLLKTKQ
jgi:hypothetical protein